MPGRNLTIFGIDPGTAFTGYGVIRARDNSVSWLDSGVIVPPRDADLADKLQAIYDGLSAKLREHTPVCVCVEQAFYAKNVHTTLILGHARGVALLAARQAGAQVAEYSPREVKKAIVGSGGAEKGQVQYMVRALLSPPQEHTHADAYDALAIALCGFYNYNRFDIGAAARRGGGAS